MNWIGGARNHYRRVNDEQRKQKEFFERKRLANHSKSAASIISTPCERRKSISRDILHLQCVKETKRSFSNDNSFVSHFSPGAKSRKHIVGSISSKSQVGLARGKTHTRSRQGGKASWRYKEIRHLPNVSPCSQPSTVEFVDATDDERVEPRRTFRHLPSYQSTPMFEFAHQKQTETKQNWQRQSTRQTSDVFREGAGVALAKRSSPSEDVGRRDQHETRYHALSTLHEFEESNAVLSPRYFTRDETITHGSSRANSLDVAGFADKSGKRVNFSKTNQYHSASEDSSTDPYSLFESFLHPASYDGQHSSPNFDPFENDRSAATSSSYDIAWKPAAPLHITDQESFLVCPNSNRRDIATLLPTTSAENDHMRENFLTMDDRTPTKRQDAFRWDACYAKDADYGGPRFGNSDGHTPSTALDFSKPSSLNCWLQSSTSILEISLPESPVLSSESMALLKKPIKQQLAIENASGMLKYGGSGSIALSHDEEIPGLETKSSLGWRNASDKDGRSVPVNKQENDVLPLVINDYDGLPPLSDDAALPEAGSFVDLIAVMTGGKGFTGIGHTAFHQTSPVGVNASVSEIQSEPIRYTEVSDILARTKQRLLNFNERVKQEVGEEDDIEPQMKSSGPNAKEYCDAACSPIPAEILDGNTAKVYADAMTQTESRSPQKCPAVQLGKRVMPEGCDVVAKKRQAARLTSPDSSSNENVSVENDLPARRRSKRSRKS